MNQYFKGTNPVRSQSRRGVGAAVSLPAGRISGGVKVADGIRRKAGGITPPLRLNRPPAPEPEDAVKEYEEIEEVGRQEILTEGDSQIIITGAPLEATFPDFLFNKSGKRWFLSRFWLNAWGGIAVFILLVVLLSTVFARVTVFVKPRAENVALRDIAVAFDSSVARNLTAQKVVPAGLLEFKKVASGEFEATGKEFIEDRAHGQVIVYNRFSSSPQTIVQNTRFLTNNGTLFRLTQTAVIPGAKIAEGKIIPQSLWVELKADSPGEGSNIVDKDTVLKIPGFQGTPKYDGFYAIAPSGFNGGFKGEARVVSAEDLKKAEEQVSKKVFDELNQEIVKKIPPDFKFMESLREIEILRVNSTRVNTRAEKFSVEAEAKARSLIFKERDVLSLLKDLVLTDEPIKEFIEGSHNINYHVRNIDFNKGRAEVSISGDIKAKSVIKKEELIQASRGKKEGSIIEILKGRNDIAKFRLAFFPPWLLKAPGSGDKIRVIVEEP